MRLTNKLLFLLILILPIAFFSCQKMPGTGGIALTVVIPHNRSFYPSSISSSIIRKGTVDVTVSKGNWSTHKSFPFTDYSGVITGIPAGKGYTVKVIARFITLYYGGAVSNIVVLPGIITNVGIVHLQKIPQTISFERKKPPAPVITYPPMYKTFVTRDTTITIYGLKATGTAIVVNEYERVHANDSTHWSVVVQLNKNQWNHFKVVERRYFADKTALDSDPVYVTILHDWNPPTRPKVDFSFTGTTMAAFKVSAGIDPKSPMDGSHAGILGVAVFRGATCPQIKQGEKYSVGSSYDNSIFVGYYSSYFTDETLVPATSYHYCFYSVDKAFNYSGVTEYNVKTAMSISLNIVGKVITADSYFFSYLNNDAIRYLINGTKKVEYKNVEDMAVAPGAYALLFTDNVISVFRDDDTKFYSFPVTSNVYGLSMTITTSSVPYLAYSQCTSISVVDTLQEKVLNSLKSISGSCICKPYIDKNLIAYIDSSTGKVKIWDYVHNMVITPDIGYGGAVTNPVLVEGNDGYYIGFKGNKIAGFAHLDSSFKLVNWRVFPALNFDLDGKNFYLTDGKWLKVVPLAGDSYNPLIFSKGEWFDVSVTQKRLLWVGSGFVGYH